MNKLLTTLFALGALAVASVTALAQAPSQPPTKPEAGVASPAALPNAKSLEAKTAQCMGCHNIKGYQSSFPEVYKVPMIAGQNAKYIAAALNAYKNGDRKHPTMRGVATTLSDQDITDISAYYEALGKEASAAAPEQVRQPDARVAGLLQKAACASCHGANFSKPIDPSYPKLAGQHKDYLFVALKSYKVENNQAVGRNNGVMGAIAKQYSNAELKALADYMASIDGELRTVPESRFHQH